MELALSLWDKAKRLVRFSRRNTRKHQARTRYRQIALELLDDRRMLSVNLLPTPSGFVAEFSDDLDPSDLNLYDVREELGPLVESCRNEPKNGANRKLIVDKLIQLVEKDVGDSKPQTDAP